MIKPSDNKYTKLERQIDEILSDGKIYILPPGFWVFVLVNVLMMIGVAMLVVVAQDVLFVGQILKAAVFSVIAILGLALIIVTPAFFVMRGFRKAVNYLRVVIIAVLTLIVAFGVVNVINHGTSSIFIGIGLMSMMISFLLVYSNSYQLLSIFTSRRREMALRDIEEKKHFFSK